MDVKYYIWNLNGVIKALYIFLFLFYFYSNK